MSILDICARGEYYRQASEVKVADVLENLRAELAFKEQEAERLALDMRQLRTAIRAIEREAALAEREKGTQRATFKRGYLATAVVTCVEEGIGTVGLINKTLALRGIKTSGPSISNAIQRLQAKKLIRYDTTKQMYVPGKVSEPAPKNTAPPQSDEANI